MLAGHWTQPSYIEEEYFASLVSSEGFLGRVSLAVCMLLIFHYVFLPSVHYDQAYSQREEGYPDIVVHGPILCTLMLDMYQQQIAESTNTHSGFKFSYRAVRPMFLSSAITVEARRNADGVVEMCTLNDAGHVCMSAQVTLL
jgi:hydroxyacyl-ACP dehydratase HTD2-like protein with hotdog domain